MALFKFIEFLIDFICLILGVFFHHVVDSEFGDDETNDEGYGDTG